MKQSDVRWSAQHFRRIADNGTWGVPRSGLLFQRRGDTLVLTARMPHHPDMPLTEHQLANYQQTDFEDIKKHFGAAGIAVLDLTRN